MVFFRLSRFGTFVRVFPNSTRTIDQPDCLKYAASKGHCSRFHYMAISDKMQRYMPTAADRDPPRGQALDYKEAVLLVNPVDPQFKGEVDDKYEYSVESKDIKVHGWVVTDTPSVGFWQITPSNEFRSGGPNKQELTSHVGPTCLTDFLSSHYVGGEYITLQVAANEPWNKVYGPVFIYLNSGPAGGTPSQLWEDAGRQMQTEVQNWPYGFPASEDFPKLNQRGSIDGRLQVRDRYARNVEVPASNAYVGLALPGAAGSWQTESKGYQFWTTTDENGDFSIKSVRPGNYNLYAWVPGFIGDYKYDTVINITPGSNVQVNNLVYEPLRDGPTLWEIGIPDRSVEEFYIPDPGPNYINKLYVNDAADRFRQYGLWEKYAELYPRGDMVFTVGTSDYRKDWFYAQVTRKISANKFQGTTWQIKFKLAQVDDRKTYKLRVAIAGAELSHLQVRVNNPNGTPVFSSGLFGRDNSIARHGIHGLYFLFNIDVPGAQLVVGDNTIFLTQPSSNGAFQGIMYDYIRLEGPPL
ncbi:Rhamnogalacturonate lyase family protein [Tripterygium wilfordii]|uniref:rhamnogalacturonan endolyase n=1 Tax=Tripterygium wilfordii TaxID=458696 RepID=A0A7J7D1C0_TRIWF|nr:Rhamnogalacturonate lyase family protein [Tripterygium wilfordii]